ncbi:Taurine catabolism dioxygenase TauD/TfdA [Mycena sanguinolenta]|uniref:Taurine catabolism dioxygenase TauD/TfdA n=1 Tax=Mycena sanguinolenta TaxID=230812 RepID=A0A8H7CNA5_9AGAR|nr:Taurine catabolism dioxygenase TauD/TfdA [Mycena sanguinolenta]
MATLAKSTIQTLKTQGFKFAARPVVRGASRALATSISRATVATNLAEKALDPKTLASDYEFLRNLVKSIPLVLHKPVVNVEDERYFQLPLGTLFAAPTRELGLQMKETFAFALQEKGVAIIELGFDDPKSNFMLELVEAMGCVPDTHSSNQGALWEVTYKPSGVISAKTGATAHSRSHGDGEFAWHTDGSFEACPQRFFGLHIVHPDHLGGGIFRVLPAEDLVAALSPQSVKMLLQTEFDLQVPEEFYKGKATNRGRLLEIDPTTGRYLLRFRRDILADPPSPDPAANAAIEELNSLLENPETKGWRFPDDVFKENVVVLMDNARFLHMRTQIRDRRRLLRRVRFHGLSAANQRGEINLQVK